MKRIALSVLIVLILSAIVSAVPDSVAIGPHAENSTSNGFNINNNSTNSSIITESVTYDVTNDIELSCSDSITNMDIVVALVRSIPPYQEVVSRNFNRNPDKIITDGLGNQYAIFSDLYDISIQYEVKVNGLRFNLTHCNGTLPKEFIAPEKYIESDAPEVKDRVNKLINENDSVCNESRAFFDYVSENMRYTGYNPNGVGALAALRSLSGDCTEYSDILVAFNRAAGIPARTFEGILCEPTGEAIVHNWLEVYLPGNGWIPVDATTRNSNYFGGTTPDRIIVAIGRTFPQLDGHHYFSYKYRWYGEPGSARADGEWRIKKHKTTLLQ